MPLNDERGVLPLFHSFLLFSCLIFIVDDGVAEFLSLSLCLLFFLDIGVAEFLSVQCSRIVRFHSLLLESGVYWVWFRIFSLYRTNFFIDWKRQATATRRQACVLAFGGCHCWSVQYSIGFFMLIGSAGDQICMRQAASCDLAERIGTSTTEAEAMDRQHTERWQIDEKE